MLACRNMILEFSFVFCLIVITLTRHIEFLQLFFSQNSFLGNSDEIYKFKAFRPGLDWNCVWFDFLDS